MVKILFVCHGNICRSPMAEFVFKDMIARDYPMVIRINSDEEYDAIMVRSAALHDTQFPKSLALSLNIMETSFPQATSQTVPVITAPFILKEVTTLHTTAARSGILTEITESSV